MNASGVLPGIALAIAATSIHAQPLPVYPGGETIVTATRIPQRLSESLRDVTVITAEDIAESGQLTLPEVLRHLAGVEISVAGGPGSPSSVLLRGANAAHTLVLVDGIRLQSATVGTTAFENIPLAEIERIEVVSGPASSLYGSDAVGGVIQVFTRGGRAAPPAASVALGSHHTVSANASVASRAGEATTLSVSAGFIDTDNFSATRPGVSFGRFDPDDDGYRNASFSARATHAIAPGHELGASAMASRGRARFDNGPTDDDHRTEQELHAYAAYSRNRVTDGWESLVRVGASRDDSTSHDAFGVFAFETRQLQATWQNTFRAGPGRLVLGAEYLRQRIATGEPFPVSRRTIAAAFAGYNAEWGAHAIEASLRRDDNSQFGAPTTGTVAYGYRLSPAWRMRAAYGTAFHAPSFNDLYFPGFGNPALEPERSRSAEAGIAFEAGGQRVAATAFDNRIRDLIAFELDPATGNFLPRNVARVRIRGVELSWDARLVDTRIRAKVTWQDPRTEPHGFQLQRRARRHGSLAATRDIGPWRLLAEVEASGERFDSADEDPATRLAGYAVFNVALSRRLSPRWTLDLRCNNVGDKDYEWTQGFNTPGRHVLLTVRWTGG